MTTVDAETVRLRFRFRAANVPMGDVEAVDVATGRFFCGVRIRHAGGVEHVSGLHRTDAGALADAIETARGDWWCRSLAARTGILCSVHDRIVEFADPPKYLTADALREIEADARAAAAGFAVRWPEAIAHIPEIRMLRSILKFLETPDDARAKANEYIRKFDIRSLKGEAVRSFEECEIANFLYLNGVAYEYEAPYEHDLATSQKRQYKPDFHLPDHGIYIEHFGTDAEGNTAPFVNRERYLRQMEWKRGIHAEHGTVLIETFSHEQADGRLLRNLTEKLASHGVALSPIPPEKTFAVLEEQGRVDPFTRLVATFLQHFKGSGLSFDEIAERTGRLRDRARAQIFLAVFQPIFERYQETLARSGEIDFNDCRDCGGEIEACPECEGWLDIRMGRYGRFLGCSNFPDCDYTRNLQPSRKRAAAKESRFRAE